MAAAWIVAAWHAAALWAQDATPGQARALGGRRRNRGGAPEPVDAELLAEKALDSEEPKEGSGGLPGGGQLGLPRIDLWDLTKRGGFLMIPLGLVSLLVVTFGLERMIALRAPRQVLPPVLFDGLRRWRGQKGGSIRGGPTRLCNKAVSLVGLAVILSMLVRLGRPTARWNRRTATRTKGAGSGRRLYANVLRSPSPWASPRCWDAQPSAA